MMFKMFTILKEVIHVFNADEKKTKEKFGKLFRERFMDIKASMGLIEALDEGWRTMAECFEPAELLMKQELIDEYYPKQKETAEAGV